MSKNTMYSDIREPKNSKRINKVRAKIVSKIEQF